MAAAFYTIATRCISPLETRGRATSAESSCGSPIRLMICSSLYIYVKKKKKCLNIRSQRTGTGAFIAVYLLCCSEEAAPAQPAAHHHEGDSSLYISASLAEVVICPRSAASHFPCMHVEKSLIKKKSPNCLFWISGFNF